MKRLRMAKGAEIISSAVRDIGGEGRQPANQ